MLLKFDCIILQLAQTKSWSSSKFAKIHQNLVEWSLVPSGSITYTIQILSESLHLLNFSLSSYQIPVNIWVIEVSHDNILTSLTRLFYIIKEYSPGQKFCRRSAQNW